MPKKTVEMIISQGNDSLIQIKSNQKGLLHNVTYLATHKSPLSTFRQEGKRERNRIEYREVSVFKLPLFNLPDEWDGIFQSVVRGRRYVDKLNTKKKIWELQTEVSYYGATCILEAERAAQYIRNHWFIENKNHYVRDVSLAEV